MSSSVFIESSSLPKSTAETEAALSNSADTNLVVVYGKHGVNFDRKGLENLIEEKTLSSISVIRLTSPTPSMEAEEEAAKGNLGSDESDEGENIGSSTEDDSQEKTKDSNDDAASAGDGANKSVDEYDDGTNVDNKVSDAGKNKRKMKRKPANTKSQKLKRKQKNERPEIVGLTVEEFYTAADANAVLKEALKKAGVSTIKHSAEYEFQLYVIKNDHCYTPYTSPDQIKMNMASAKPETEKEILSGRKVFPQTVIPSKNLFIRKKIQPQHLIEVRKVSVIKSKVDIKEDRGMGDKIQKHIVSDELIEDDEEMHTSSGDEEEDENVEEEEDEDDESEFYESEESLETDNDRDSDLDFDVNNRKGRKRKVKLLKKVKRSSAIKAQTRRYKLSQEESDEAAASATTVSRAKGNKILSSGVVGRPVASKPSVLPTSSKSSITCKPADSVVMPRTLSEAIAHLPPIPKKQTIIAREITQKSPLITAVRRGPIVQVGGSCSKNSKIQSSSQTVKEIVINKVIASPKCGFTNIGTLLTQSDGTTPTTPTSSICPQNKNTPTSKGFMPLGIETAARNQLPAQISIQTHQSSTELAAEHDKQLDLIDSIVKNEMQKCGLLEQEASVGENIPELVEMLESSAKALESNKLSNVNENYTENATSNDVDIDITNGPLLDTPVDDIPEDFIQHVVKLMENDKTLQEEVEKEVFGENSSEAVSSVLSTSSVAPPLTPIFPDMNPHGEEVVMQQQIQQPLNQPTKSIIQMTISNTIRDDYSASPAANISFDGQSHVPGIHTPKSTPFVRKEPIQIVRGNGRVITLPPIEAPTTRAKRRAQAHPSQQTSFSVNAFNDSSLDSSLQSNSSFTATPASDISVVEKKLPAEATTKRRVSKENNSGSAVTSRSSKKPNAKKSAAGKSAANASKSDNIDDLSSQGDDDDPNKLWCICRQPHNNRFMICCDICEDWFHGTCVNITKAMGLEMEQKSIDWTCPKCVKTQEEKSQRKITDMLLTQSIEKSTGSIDNPDLAAKTTFAQVFGDEDVGFSPATSTPKSAVPPRKQLIDIKKIQSGQFISLKNLEQIKKVPLPIAAIVAAPKKAVGTSQLGKSVTPSNVKRDVVVQNVNKPILGTSGAAATVLKSEDPLAHCIVCKKTALSNSIYCSDDCIKKYVQNSIQVYAAKSPEATVPSVQAKGIQDDKKKKSKGLFEDLLSMADRKPKIERVHVFERKTGRVLIGHSAPTTANLKKWLQDNPTYEVVQPGSIQAIEIEKRQKQRALHSSSSSLTVANKSFILKTPPQLVTRQIAASPTVQHAPSRSTAGTGAVSNLKSDGGQTNLGATTPQPKSVRQLVVRSKILPNSSNSGSSRPGTPKQLHKYPQQVSLKPDKSHRLADSKDDTKSKEKTAKRQSGDNANNKKATESTTAATDPEPIRWNVRRTMKEHLLLRIGELPANESKLTPEEVAAFVKKMEAEMYSYYNHDTGHKYKTKYRSLMFNIKDRKNHTLLAKICAKDIGAKQLVYMSPEELASQELALWRENETKHQLEMIKKSELDMLSCAKNYVLKTHKGEEVIEDTLTDRVKLDLTIPVEDVVSALNNSTVGSSERSLDESSMSAASAQARKDYHQASESFETTASHYQYEDRTGLEKSADHGKVLHKQDKDREREKERERNRERERERERDYERAHDHDKRHKCKDRHRAKSRSSKHSHSRSRSRSSEKRRKISHKDDRRDREDRNDRRTERGRSHTCERGVYSKERDRHRDDTERKSLEKKVQSGLAHSKLDSLSKTANNSAAKETKKKTTAAKPLVPYSLIDQILESTKSMEEAANLPPDNKVSAQQAHTTQQTIEAGSTTTHKDSKTVTTANSTNMRPTDDMVDYDQEPTSTVSIATPPHDPYLRYSGVDSPASCSGSPRIPANAIWGGIINMIDVASFQIILQAVVGNSVNLGKLLPSELDVVGRIGPDTVWDYILKIKKSPNKEIVIIRLLPASESETSAYTILYQYLNKRNRLGVIKTTSSQIKDFYIYPLGAGKRMPAILQPLERVDFYEDTKRPDMLVGIVIRVIGKRTTAATTSFQNPLVSTAPSTAKFSRTNVAATDSLTPPGSPKRRKTLHSAASKGEEFDMDAIIKGPIASKINKIGATLTSSTVTTTYDDADEPYSPGGSSGDDTPLLSVKSAVNPPDGQKPQDDDLKRKMEDLNRQIAEQELEIAGLLHVESSRFTSTSSKSTVLANISIPSNLSQILASINSKPETQPPLIGALIQRTSADEEYNPEEAITSISYESTIQPVEKTSSNSRLAQLSEAELLSMVPDDMIDETSLPQPPSVAVKPMRFEEPPPPGV